LPAFSFTLRVAVAVTQFCSQTFAMTVALAWPDANRPLSPTSVADHVTDGAVQATLAANVPVIVARFGTD
jgi:hypothetical protein